MAGQDVSWAAAQFGNVCRPVSENTRNSQSDAWNWNSAPSESTKALARAFADEGLIGPFFAGLAEQEQYHADLLEVCRAAAARKGWKSQLFNPWNDYLPRLEQQMDAAYADVWKIDSVEAALQLVVEMSRRQINQVFRAAGRHGFGLCEEAAAV